MLGDQSSAVGDQGVGAFLFGSFVIPGTGKGDLHGSVGNNRANAEEPGGVTGDHFCIGVSADVADFHVAVLIVVGLGEDAVVDHFLEFEAGGNTCKVTAFIDGSESIVEVVEIHKLSLIAGRMQELDFGIFLRGADHVILVAEAVGKNNITAVICEVASDFVAVFAFGNTGFDHEFSAHLCAGFLRGGDEVVVIGGVFIMQGDEADFDRIIRRSESAEGNDHYESKKQSSELFHRRFLS